MPRLPRSGSRRLTAPASLPSGLLARPRPPLLSFPCHRVAPDRPDELLDAPPCLSPRPAVHTRASMRPDRAPPSPTAPHGRATRACNAPLHRAPPPPVAGAADAVLRPPPRAPLLAAPPTSVTAAPGRAPAPQRALALPAHAPAAPPLAHGVALLQRSRARAQPSAGAAPAFPPPLAVAPTGCILFGRPHPHSPAPAPVDPLRPVGL